MYRDGLETTSKLTGHNIFAAAFLHNLGCNTAMHIDVRAC